MTEAEWLACTDPTAMLDFLRDKASERKLRLLTCAILRRFMKATIVVGWQSVDLAEKWADGTATIDDARAFRKAHRGSWLALERDVGAAASNLLGAVETPLRTELPSLFRHIIGNPFRPYPTPSSWPSSVMQLADALYNGQDCGFALHDALLEVGHAELAQHFQEEKEHPKGCWVVDLILGKS